METVEQYAQHVCNSRCYDDIHCELVYRINVPYSPEELIRLLETNHGIQVLNVKEATEYLARPPNWLTLDEAGNEVIPDPNDVYFPPFVVTFKWEPSQD